MLIPCKVGQCGNQLGDSLWRALDAQSCGADGNREEASLQFFRLDQSGKRTARCLLVDTEPKVVGGLIEGLFNNLHVAQTFPFGR